MNKNSIKVKQICALFICLLPLSKIVSAPAIIAKNYAEKIWFPPLVWFLFELLFIGFVFVLDKMHGGKTFFDILSSEYSENFAKAIYFFYGVFFFIKSFLPLIEHKALIETAFYEILPSTPIFYPLFLVTFYISLKGLKALGRAAEFCLPLSWAGLITIMFLAVPSGNAEVLLPLFHGNKSGAISLLSTVSWFGDALYFLFFMGHFEKEKRSVLRVLSSYAIPAVFTLGFFVCFYAVFAFVAETQLIAVKEVGIFSVTLQNVGRFDYIAVFLIALASVLSVSFPIVTSVKMFERVFPAKNAFIPALVINVLLLAATYLFAQKYQLIVEIYQKYLYPLFIFVFILPLLGLKRRKNEKLQTS